jgi:hypothetical protein
MHLCSILSEQQMVFMVLNLYEKDPLEGIKRQVGAKMGSPRLLALGVLFGSQFGTRRLDRVQRQGVGTGCRRRDCTVGNRLY